MSKPTEPIIPIRYTKVVTTPEKTRFDAILGQESAAQLANLLADVVKQGGSVKLALHTKKNDQKNFTTGFMFVGSAESQEQAQAAPVRFVPKSQATAAAPAPTTPRTYSKFNKTIA